MLVVCGCDVDVVVDGDLGVRLVEARTWLWVDEAVVFAQVDVCVLEVDGGVEPWGES